MRLADRLLAIHAALEGAGISHAFGGAIALGYWTREPRGTRDLDVNVFAPPDECEPALDALPDEVRYDDSDVAMIKRDGQVRLEWGDTPVDLFFSNLPIHDEAESHRRQVPFEGVEIPILGPLELGIFKAMFDRTQDWADLEAMLEAETLDVDALRGQLTTLLGADDPRLTRIDEAVRRASPG